MTTWTVHAPPGDVAAAAAADGLVILPETMSWGALLVPFLWAPWHRAWLVFAGWLVVTVAIEATDTLGDGRLAAILSGAFVIWFALVANDLRRWTLERRGFRLVGLVEARDVIEAEARFLGRLADPHRPVFGVVEPPPAPPRAAPHPTPAGSAPPRDLPPIVGFPDLAGGHS